MSTDERRPSRGPAGEPHRGQGAPRRAPEGRRAPEDRRPSQGRPTGRPQGEPRPRREHPGEEPRRSSRPAESRQHTAAPSKQRASKPPKKKGGVGKYILIGVEVVALVALCIFLLKFVVPATKTGKVELPEEDIIINEEVKASMVTTSESGANGQTSAMSGYRNIALFGVDSREGALTKNTRSDTIIIASINEKTGDVKLCSVYRDTYLNLSNDSYNKCNAAYAKGGPMQAINMLNMNLDMNITDFVTIGFEGLTAVIDALGGVEVNVLESEIVHLNNYQISMVGKSSDGETFTADAGSDYTPVTKSGVQVLNGLQATAYCRIRYVGNDFQRAERQRTVIMACLDKAKQNPTKLPDIAQKVFDKTYTSLDLSEIISILGDITKYKIVDQAGFPMNDKVAVATIGKKGSCVIPVDLKDNVVWLHEFLFGADGYEPSEAVKKYSEQVKSDTSPYL